MKLAKPILWSLVSASVILSGCVNPPPKPKAKQPATPVVSAETLDEEARRAVRTAMMQLIDSNRFEEAYHWEIPGSIVSGRKAAQEELQRIRSTILVDRWSSYLIQRMKNTVKSLIAQKEFEKAREILWRIQPTDCVAVNAKVDAARVELMNTEINVTEWESLHKTIVERMDALLREEKLDEASKYIAGIPEIRTYTSLFDKQIDVVCGTLIALGIPSLELAPVTDQVRALIAKILADATEDYEESSEPEDRPDFSRYMSEVNKLRTLLVRYGCSEGDADKVIKTMKEGFAPLISQYCLRKTAPAVQKLVGLGTTQVNVKLNALRAEYTEKITQQIVAKALQEKNFKQARQLAMRNRQANTLIQLLIAEVRFHIENKDWDAARATIRDFERVGDSGVDAAVFAVRIGLLNSEVNPAQCADILRKMDARYSELVGAQQFEEAYRWLVELAPVRDDYPRIFASLAEIEQVVLAEDALCPISSVLTETKEELSRILDRREGSYTEPNDALEKALEGLLKKLESSIEDQTLNTSLAKGQAERLKKWILAALKREPMTTAEMNSIIADRREALLSQLVSKLGPEVALDQFDPSLRAFVYARLLKEMSVDVDFEAQIAVAENAMVAKQTTLHAVLGEYAQVFRLLKLGKALTDEQKASLMVGAVYLDQPQVVRWACKMGANPSSPSVRDPLRRAPLLVAIQTGNTDLVQVLADVGAAPSATDARGETALHYAVRLGNRSVIRTMLVTNNVNTADNFGWTPIFIAAARNQAALVAFLIEQQANVMQKDKNGCTALDIACITGSRDVLPLLAEAGAPFSETDLAFAVCGDHLAIAQWLVNQGLDVNHPNVNPEEQNAGGIYGQVCAYLRQTGTLVCGGLHADDEKNVGPNPNKTQEYLLRQGRVQF